MKRVYNNMHADMLLFRDAAATAWTEIERLKADNYSLKADNERLKAYDQPHWAEIKRLKEEMSELKADNERLEGEMSDTWAEIDRMRSSNDRNKMKTFTITVFAEDDTLVASTQIQAENGWRAEKMAGMMFPNLDWIALLVEEEK